MVEEAFCNWVLSPFLFGNGLTVATAGDLL